MRNYFVLLSIFYIVIEGTDIPSSFLKCKRNDENFSTCLTQSANDEWPKFVKAYNLNKIPFETEKVVPYFANGAMNGTILGFENIKFNHINIDFKNKGVDIIYSQPILSAIGDYKMKGRFIGFDMDEHGEGNFTYTNGIYNFHFDYDMEQFEDDNYIQLTSSKLPFQAEKLTAIITSIDNPERGEKINSLFENSWRILSLLLDGSAGEVFSEAYTPIIQKHFSKLQMKSFFD